MKGTIFARLLSFFHLRRLFVDITFLFSFFFFITSTVIISYFYKVSANTTLKIAGEFIAHTEKDIINKISQILQPKNIIRVSKSSFNNSKLDFSNQKIITNYLRDSINVFPHVFEIYLADQYGSYISEKRILPKHQDSVTKAQQFTSKPCYLTTLIQPKNNSTQNNPAKNNKVQKNIYQDCNEKTIKNIDLEKPRFNPLVRPWYLGAIKYSPNYWLGIYHFAGLHQEGITSSYAIINSKGEKIGVIGIDMTLLTLQNLLIKSKPTESSIIFILHDEKVIADSNRTMTTRKFSLDQAADKRIKTAYNEFKKNKKESFIIKFEGKKYITEFTHYPQKVGSPWTIGIMVPIDHYISAYKKTNIIMLLFSGLWLIIGLFFIILLSKRISKPIALLAKKVARLKEFRLNTPISIKTNIAEVETMRKTVESVRKGLISFGRYIPKELVRSLIRIGNVAKIGGERKTLTILFSDIKNFTTIAEKMPPQQLTEHLCDYLEKLITTITRHNGTIDKYIGDAIMAFWGAPISNSQQAQEACYTALQCQIKIHEFNEEAEKKGLPKFETRFGLHMGEVVNGNIGCSERLNYTIIGDNVNLTARLEAINKNYGTHVIISDELKNAVGSQFLTRPIDVVTVKGKTESIIIHELMAAREREDEIKITKALQQLATLTEQAFHYYQQQQWQLALSTYQAIQAQFPDDPLAKIYIKLCQENLS